MAAGSHANPAIIDKLTAAIRYVTENRPLDGIVTIADLKLPADSEEAKRCEAIQTMLAAYAKRGLDARPFSIAVFGPPGAGKSHIVRALLAPLRNQCGEPIVINLSQVSNPKGLAEVFSARIYGTHPDGFKLFFFDEFDTTLDGVSLGWLRWFLAPMQDASFFFKGQTFVIGKAVFIFAGGTASSLDDLKGRAQRDPGYVDKKVPDFISRLRGFIDIQGVNTLKENRPTRRALALASMLKKRWPDRCKPGGGFPIAEKLAEGLLSNAHFVHGVRSMEAVLDMAHFHDQPEFTEEHLPDKELLTLHISRGLFDGKLIGVSAGRSDPASNPFLGLLTSSLFRNGATLAYGGDYIHEGTLKSLVDSSKATPDDLVGREDQRIRNYRGFPNRLSPSAAEIGSDAVRYIDFLDLETLSADEMQLLGVREGRYFKALPENRRDGPYSRSQHFAWALSLFRMRLRMAQDIDALIVLGGKDGGSWGRFSGIAEEVVLALALGKPVYVLGGRGGAAQAVGMLLGLDNTVANPNTWLKEGGRDISSYAPKKGSANPFEGCFQIPGGSQLPQTIPQIRSYLFRHAAFTPAWPWNGLSLDENRKLFKAAISNSKAEDCVEPIFRGLTRLDWDRDTKGRASAPLRATADR